MEERKQLNSILLTSAMQSICLLDHKKLPWDPFFFSGREGGRSFLSETQLLASSVSFSFSEKGHQKETKYPGKEVEIKENKMFSHKVSLLQRSKKVVYIARQEIRQNTHTKEVKVKQKRYFHTNQAFLNDLKVIEVKQKKMFLHIPGTFSNDLKKLKMYPESNSLDQQTKYLSKEVKAKRLKLNRKRCFLTNQAFLED